ncbi:DUF1904 family protein [Ilyobacter polytropus]|uniref:Uncharacterized protein n=1 Tax=Ilyobacter polytropus (strain ATCC 51220 / DSM 2926 / LMG 16218 / CuHBu1) TaxID=572544 RepID=E3HBU3_ILYPC|nr:DUF1904 family protein [Ilyobacter polytropus]ADO83855.1 hypothetical protein Ilyop_2088 [Ilyobacter polytropus DSM 2926]
MPKILCQNIKEETISEVSKDLTLELADILGIPKERISFIVPSCEEFIIKEGEKSKAPHYIKITWRERPEDLMQAVAKSIKAHFSKAGVDNSPIYFENIFKKIK